MIPVHAGASKDEGLGAYIEQNSRVDILDVPVYRNRTLRTWATEVIFAGCRVNMIDTDLLSTIQCLVCHKVLGSANAWQNFDLAVVTD